MSEAAYRAFAADPDDLYAALGLLPGDHPSEIVRAIKAAEVWWKARSEDPDLGRSVSQAFERLQLARLTLLDPARRTAYDRNRAASHGEQDKSRFETVVRLTIDALDDGLLEPHEEEVILSRGRSVGLGDAQIHRLMDELVKRTGARRPGPVKATTPEESPRIEVSTDRIDLGGVDPSGPLVVQGVDIYNTAGGLLRGELRLDPPSPHLKIQPQAITRSRETFYLTVLPGGLTNGQRIESSLHIVSNDAGRQEVRIPVTVDASTAGEKAARRGIWRYVRWVTMGGLALLAPGIFLDAGLPQPMPGWTIVIGAVLGVLFVLDTGLFGRAIFEHKAWLPEAPWLAFLATGRRRLSPWTLLTVIAAVAVGGFTAVSAMRYGVILNRARTVATSHVPGVIKGVSGEGSRRLVTIGVKSHNLPRRLRLKGMGCRSGVKSARSSSFQRDTLEARIPRALAEGFTDGARVRVTLARGWLSLYRISRVETAEK